MLEYAKILGREPMVRAMAIEVIHPETYDLAEFMEQNKSLLEILEDSLYDFSVAEAHDASSVIIFDFGDDGADVVDGNFFFEDVCETLVNEYEYYFGGQLHCDSKPFGDEETIAAGYEANREVMELWAGLN